MEEIKVEEYVRTKRHGICKLLKCEIDGAGEWCGLVDVPIFLRKDNILKHSLNIIDLIEVGDYVNGERVIETHNRANDDGEKVILTENYNAWTDDGIVSNKYIKTIVTREQFKGVMYEVK